MALPAGRYGVTKNQLLKIKKLPMNTIKLIEELTEKFNLLGTAAFKNSTSVVTESSDLVESGAVYDALGFGNKNLLNADILFASASHHDINLSVSNQIISLNGTVSGDSGYYFGDANKKLTLPAGTYTFSIVGSGDFGTTSEIRVRKSSDSSKIVGIYTNDITPVSFTLNADTEVFIAIVNSNATIGTSVNATLKIQLEKGTTATTYEPYHASVEETLRDAEVVQGKNLLPLTLDSIKALNVSNWSWNGNVGSNNGVDFTISTDSNGYVTKIRANGTATGGNANLHIINNKSYGDIILNGCPSGGANDKYYIRFLAGSAYLSDYGSGVEITGTISDAWIGIVLNKQVTNLDFYPMIRKATETDPTYEPYYVPLKDVVPQKCDNSVIAPVENGTTASQAYAVGSHAIRNGAFITWKNAKAQGETINDASDYTSGDVADLLTPPKLLPSNANLNNYIAEGEYFAGADTYDNCPLSNTAFRLKVLPFNNPATRCIQIIYANQTEPEIYMRTNFSGTWQSWYKFTGTVVV